MSRWPTTAIALCALLLAPVQAFAQSTGRCNAPRDLVRFRADLPATTAATRKNEINIVALGSSSTAGSGASSPHASYPARLDVELDRRFPGRDFHVSNFGAGGQLAADMLERIHGDILPFVPSLVLWQTGVNDAIQGVPLGRFRETLLSGVKMLRDAGIDVVLIDMQYYPRSERVAGYEDYLRVMREVAEAEKIPLFRRFAVMKHLIRSGQFSSDQLLAPDNFHLNDLSYGCLAGLLADAIEDVVKSQGRDASQLMVPPAR